MALHSVWVSGHSVLPFKSSPLWFADRGFPFSDLSGERNELKSGYSLKDGNDISFCVSIPTPAEVAGVSLRLDRFHVFYDISGGTWIKDIRISMFPNQLAAPRSFVSRAGSGVGSVVGIFDTPQKINLDAATWMPKGFRTVPEDGITTFYVRSQPTCDRGLAIIVVLAGPFGGGAVDFFSIGAEFHTPPFPTP